MECESMLFVSNHIPIFEVFQISNCVIDFYSCEVVSSSDTRKNEASVLTLWIYFMWVVAKCFNFVMSYMRQNKRRKQTLESAQYGLEIIFTANQIQNLKKT